MFKIHNRVKEKTSTVGTGPLSLFGSSPGFITFSSFYDDNDQLFYCTINGFDFEIGVGTYFNNSITRNRVLSSSNANQLVHWPPGDKEIYVTYPAENAVYQPEGINNADAPEPEALAYWVDKNTISSIAYTYYRDNTIVSEADFNIGVLTNKFEHIDPVTANIPMGSARLIKGLDGKIQVWVNDAGNIRPMDGGSGSVSFNLIFNEVPTGTMNGINRTFNSAFNFASATLSVHLNGLRQKIGSDYQIINSNTIMLTVAPSSTENLSIDYQKI
jgi:hypothetical protein